MSTRRFLINLAVYQVCWLSCILGAAHSMPWLGVVIVAAAIAYHLFDALQAIPELILILIAMLIGAAWDSLLVAMGLLIYPSGLLFDNAAPYWIVALWAGFATTFNVSLAWFKNRLLAASLLGGFGGPLAYLAGERLGAVEFSSLFTAMIALALGWAVLMPIMMVLSRHWNGFVTEPGRPATIAG